MKTQDRSLGNLSNSAAGVRILRLPSVIARTGLSRSSIYLRISKSEFPAAISLGPRCVGFVESEIDDWITARIEQSRTAA
jgi:prophage regulatory protein